MITIHSEELQPGDVIEDHGTVHRVTHIDRHPGWAFPVAFDDAGWAIALGHDLVAVERDV
jgi:hypothetical protein